MSEWQPIETAPKDGTEILAWVEAGRGWRRILQWREQDDPPYEDGWWCDIEEQYMRPYHVSQWQPLPDPPK